jgi:Protein of unknown function (DUF2752)
MKVRRPWTWLALAGTLGVLVLRFAWPSWPALMPGCTVRRFTGLHCPGCGGTRCAMSLLDGDLAGALSMNAAVVVAALAFAGVIAAGVWQEWKGGSGRVFPSWLAWGLTAFVVVFGLVRNLPWWPFTLLVPH